jgi:hypothetical protein
MWKGSVPIFRRVDGAGRDGGTERLWQQREMLVAVLDDCPRCRDVERALRVDADEEHWAHQHAGVVILRIDASREHEPIVDQVIAALAQLGVAPGAPTLAIADRFGRLCAALDVHERDPDELVNEARAWIDFIQEQCEECGVPVEPPAEAPLADSADDSPG